MEAEPGKKRGGISGSRLLVELSLLVWQAISGTTHGPAQPIREMLLRDVGVEVFQGLYPPHYHQGLKVRTGLNGLSCLRTGTNST